MKGDLEPVLVGESLAETLRRERPMGLDNPPPEGSPSSLGHVPAGERWAFDQGVADVFDDMLRRSIPQLDQMRALVLEIGARRVVHKTDVVDLGSSRGDAIAAFHEKFGAYIRCVAVEVAPPMVAALRRRFACALETGLVEVRETDLRGAYPPVRASLTLSVLTLQFTPIEHRLRILADAYAHTVDGGALILVEKVLGSDAPVDALLTDAYREHKRRAGYTDDEIRRKALALEGVLVPLTARFNEELLRGAGFRSVEPFWRWLNFAGWIAIR